MSKEMVEVVNDAGEVLEIVERAVIKPGDPRMIRTVVLVGFTPSGQLVYQERAHHKGSMPGLFDHAAAGGVFARESAEDAVKREASEELQISRLGITVLRHVATLKLTFPEVKPGSIDKQLFVRRAEIFTGIITEDPTPNLDELASVLIADPSDCYREWQVLGERFVSSFGIELALGVAHHHNPQIAAGEIMSIINAHQSARVSAVLL